MRFLVYEDVALSAERWLYKRGARGAEYAQGVGFVRHADGFSVWTVAESWRSGYVRRLARGAWLIRLAQPERAGSGCAVVDEHEGEIATPAEALRLCLAYLEATPAEAFAVMVGLRRADAAGTAHEAAKVARAIQERKKRRAPAEC